MALAFRFTSHQQYFNFAPLEAQPLLQQVQAVVEQHVPGAVRCISYRMPAFRLHRTFFYFAAFQNHIGIYPPVTGDASLIRDLAPYRNAKGNLAFALGSPLPLELIGRVAVALAEQYKRPDPSTAKPAKPADPADPAASSGRLEVATPTGPAGPTGSATGAGPKPSERPSKRRAPRR